MTWFLTIAITAIDLPRFLFSCLTQRCEQVKAWLLRRLELRRMK